MGSSILSEGCQHLDSQGGAPQCYYYPLNRLPASRLLLPRSGLERSDFVRWHKPAVRGRAEHVRSARVFQTSTCSAIAKASSTSIPRYRTVLSILVCPSSHDS